MKKILYVTLIVFACGLIAGCFTLGEIEKPESEAKPAAVEQGESQLDKFKRLFQADEDKLSSIGTNLTSNEIESVLNPVVINSFDEILHSALSDYGKPYYFKTRIFFKGYDKSNKTVYAQDAEKKSTYKIELINELLQPTLPKTANSFADVYVVAVSFSQPSVGFLTLIRFIRNVEESTLQPEKFILASELHFISVEDVGATNDQQKVLQFFSTGDIGTANTVFDPFEYRSDDLFNARVAMNKKTFMNEYTFPTIPIKYVSEVVFLLQNVTNVTVATEDRAVTETMSFDSRLTSLKNGEKIRLYYTIKKDPHEIWTIHAVEKL